MGKVRLAFDHERPRKMAVVHADVSREKAWHLWCKGYDAGVAEVARRIRTARAKMVVAYAKGLEKGTDAAAYHSALVVMATEVEVILDELTNREV